MTIDAQSKEMSAGFGAAGEITEGIVGGMVCRWSEDEDGNWFTGCGEAFIITEGSPSENGMKFCCYCGKPLEQHLYVEEE